MSRYFTPAALALVYVRGAETATAISLLQETAPPLQIGALHSLEMADRLRDRPRALELWQQDRKAGFYEMVEWSLGDLVRRAESLAAPDSLGIPPMDWLHIAAAMEMECIEFVDFRPAIRTAATVAGLRVRPDEWSSGSEIPANDLAQLNPVDFTP